MTKLPGAASVRSMNVSKIWVQRTGRRRLLCDDRPGGGKIWSLLGPLYFRHPRPVELVYSLSPEFFQFSQASLALPDELRHVDTEGHRFELFQTIGAVPQEARSPAPVAVLEVVETHADLEDALVEETDAPWL